MRRRLLTGHFLRQFVENDLIAPDADRHELLATIAAALIALPLCLTLLLSVKYLFRPFQSHGWTAVTALDDLFLYITASMAVMALVAVTEWDALALDWRDTLNLGLLSIPRATIVCAKLIAAGLFVAGFAVALNGAPSLLHPFLLAAKLPVSLGGVAVLVLAHAASTLAAGLFGFLGVLGLREGLALTLPPHLFLRVSAIVRAGLFILCTTALLLMPALSSRVVDRLDAGTVHPYVVPPLWFLGLHEVISAPVLDGAPRAELPPRIRLEEEGATRIYRRQQGRFRALAGMACGGLAGTALITALLYGWNTRRLPPPRGAPRPARRSWSGAASSRLATWLARRPAGAAGVSFTVHALSRSVPHRLSIAAALAGGVAFAMVCLHVTGVRGRVDAAAAPAALFAMQTVLMALLVGGARHAMRLPAHPRAGWIFRMVGGGDAPYIKGVTRAVVLAVLVPGLVALFPLHAMLLGWRVAAAHAGVGLLVGQVLLAAALFDVRKLPFVDASAPAGNPGTAAPVSVLVFAVSAALFAALERRALSGTGTTAALVLTLAALLAAVRTIDAKRRRADPGMEFEFDGGTDTQRLDLSG